MNPLDARFELRMDIIDACAQAGAAAQAGGAEGGEWGGVMFERGKDVAMVVSWARVFVALWLEERGLPGAIATVCRTAGQTTTLLLVAQDPGRLAAALPWLASYKAGLSRIAAAPPRVLPRCLDGQSRTSKDCRWPSGLGKHGASSWTMARIPHVFYDADGEPIPPKPFDSGSGDDDALERVRALGEETNDRASSRREPYIHDRRGERR